MNTCWYLEHAPSANEALHLLDEATALGLNPHFPCPIPIPDEIQKKLVVIYPRYWGLDRETHTGQIVLNRNIQRPVEEILEILYFLRFPFCSIVPIAAYNWSDQLSMLANNTSFFNFRYIRNTRKLSLHARGLAGDVNPLLNPCFMDGVADPPGSFYDPHRPGTLTADSEVVMLFRAYGFTWGGDWENPFDPQHIEYPLKLIG